MGPDAILDGLNLRLLIATRTELDERWVSEFHADPWLRLYWIESGAGAIHHHGRERALVPGWLYAIPAHSRLRYRADGRVVIRWCHATATVLGGVDLLDWLGCPLELKPAAATDAGGLMQRLIEAHADPGPGARFAERGMFLELVALFAERARPDLAAGAARFTAILEHIDRQLGTPLRIPTLARLAGMEPTAFSRAFARALGQPPVRWILRRRIATAQRLLYEGDDSLTEIADHLGFADAFHFSKAFSRLVGLPPSQFRLRSRRGWP